MPEDTPQSNDTPVERIAEAQQTVVGQSTQTLTTTGVNETWVKEQIVTAKKEVIEDAHRAIHEQIQTAMATYLAESEKFEGRGIAAAAARARAALGDLGKLSKARRAEIQAAKNAKKAAK